MEKHEKKFFYSDEVAMVSPKSGLVQYGLVLITNRSRSDKITVLWHPNEISENISDDTVVLMDRSLMSGDVVCKVINGKPSQFGYCENIDIYATVKILNTNKIIENISSHNFIHKIPFALDDIVFYESSVGVVADVNCKVKFASRDGSIFIIDDPNMDDFKSLSTISDCFPIGEKVFYRGQKLKMCLGSMESAKFINTSNYYRLLQIWKKKYSRKCSSKLIKVYVQDVTITSVQVHWFFQSSSMTKPGEEVWPENILTGDDMKKLKTIDTIDSCLVKMGDTREYKIKINDNLITKKQWQFKCTEDFNTGLAQLPCKIKKDGHHNKLQRTNNHEKKCTQNDPNQNVSSIQMQTIADRLLKKYKIMTEKKMPKIKPSASTIGISSIPKLKSNRSRRYRRRKFLVKKSKRFHEPKVSTKSNSEVAVEICFTKTMGDIIWQDGTKECGILSTDLYPVQTLHLDDLEFFPGDFVTEKSPTLDEYGVIESVDHAERTARVQWFKVYPENPALPVPTEKSDLSVYDLRGHPDFNFKNGYLTMHVSAVTNPDLNDPIAGQVLSAGADGRILVLWINGEKTQCWPQELFVIQLPDDDDYSLNDTENDALLVSRASTYDNKSDDPMSITSSSTSNKSPDDENYRRLSQKIFHSIISVVNARVKIFLDAIEHKNQEINWAIMLSLNLDQIEKRYMCFILSFFNQPSKIKDFEILMEDFKMNVKKLCPQKDDNEGKVELELSYEQIGVSNRDTNDNLKNLVSEFQDKFNRFLISPEPNKKENENNDIGIDVMDNVKPSTELPVIELDSTEFNIDVMDNVKPSTELPVIELDSTEFNIVSMDTNAVSKCEVIAKPEDTGVFEMVETLAESSHRYINEVDNMHPIMLKKITKDIQILQKSLPAGIWVKTFEDRMDLFSMMIRGPEKTPYAGGLFMIDIKLPPTYPLQPPQCHYYSFCDGRLNPNLYEDGKVCLSLLGTWHGHGVELWSPKDSNLLQLLVSIQGLILNSEPFYNEAGYESQRGQILGKENSRVYNEMVLIKVIKSMINMLNMNMNPDIINAGYFKNEILEHVKFHGPKLINTIENWMKISERELTEDEKLIPGYSLLPLSKGFCLSINKVLKEYKEILVSMNIMFK